jgi:hypothetical protein
MPINDERCWDWVAIHINVASTKVRFHPIEESCESLGPAISDQCKRNKLTQFVLVNSEHHENEKTISAGTRCIIHYQSFDADPAASEQAVEEVTACKRVVITQQVRVNILISLDFLFEFHCLITRVLADLDPSRIIGSLSRDRQSKLQSDLFCTATDRCKTLNLDPRRFGQELTMGD